MSITIPPAALEAGARALARYNCEKWDNDPDRWRAYFTDEARAAFLAIVEGWPGMLTETLVLEHDNWGGTLRSETALILPLPPQENSNE